MTTSKKTLPSVFKANMFLLIIIIMEIIKEHLFYLTHYKNFYSGTLISQYLIYLVPVILYLVFNGYNLKYILKLNKLSYEQLILISLIAICACFITVFLNNIMLAILSLFRDFPRASQHIPTASSNGQLIILLLLGALTPAICEETLFRGLIMSCYQQLGIKKSIILSGLFFGFFHFNVNIQGLLGLSFIGILFAYLVFKTNSIFASILAHLVYNSLGIIAIYFFSSPSDKTVEIINSKIIVSNVLSTATLALPAAILCFIFLKLLPKSKTSDIPVYKPQQNKNDIKNSVIKYAPLLPLILLYIHCCFIM